MYVYSYSTYGITASTVSPTAWSVLRLILRISSRCVCHQEAKPVAFRAS